MTRYIILVAALMVTNGARPAIAQTETAKLLADTDPEIQAEIGKVYDAMQRASNDVTIIANILSLNDSVDDRHELVKQLAIFFATTKGEPETHSILALMVLSRLELPERIPIRVLAPCLDSENQQLRDLAEEWFQYHDGSSRRGRPPFGSSNYTDYLEYVRSKYSKNEEVPDAFAEYIFERDPGKALLVFAYADGAGEMTKRLQQIVQALQAARRDRKETLEETRGLREQQRQEKLQRQQSRAERDEIILAEHVVGNAIWLNENGFAERLQRALPEAKAELAKLGNHDKWWARMYVAVIMRRHRELRQAEVIRQLSNDEDAHVSEVAKSIHVQ